MGGTIFLASCIGALQNVAMCLQSYLPEIILADENMKKCTLATVPFAKRPRCQWDLLPPRPPGASGDCPVSKNIHVQYLKNRRCSNCLTDIGIGCHWMNMSLSRSVFIYYYLRFWVFFNLLATTGRTEEN